MANLLTTGIPEIDRRLNLLATREANKISRSAIQAGLTTLAQIERAEVDATAGISPELKRSLRKAIGKRLVTKAKGKLQVAAKAGFGVGQQSKAKRAKAAIARGSRTRKGVGIGAPNAHWFALGTADRHQGLKTSRAKLTRGQKFRTISRTVRFVGRIQPTDIIRRAGRQGDRCFTTIEKVAREKLDAAVSLLKNS